MVVNGEGVAIVAAGGERSTGGGTSSGLGLGMGLAAPDGPDNTNKQP